VKKWIGHFKSFFSRDFRSYPFFWTSVLALIIVVIDIGFAIPPVIANGFQLFYSLVLFAAVFSIIFKYIKNYKKRARVWLFDSLSLLFFVVLLLIRFQWIEIEHFIFTSSVWVYLALLLFFLRELSDKKLSLKSTALNPAQLLIFSFLILIFLGCGFLLLPNATHNGISFIDALFTATSAVCVTGLVVVETGSYFTNFGQIVIMILIQLGGIGIMTFASYFSFFFKGGTSFENQLLLKDMTNSEKISEVFDTLKKILFLTIFIEIVGAFLIYLSLDKSLFSSFTEQVFFSVFHAVSGFCNAGFSTLGDNLFEPAFNLNYPLHLIIATLFILGSIGFPIIFNLFKYLKFYLLKSFSKFKRNQKPINLLWVVNLNTRITLVTTFFLIFGGMFFFFIFEFNNVLKDHSFFGKLVTSFFGSTARTSGFNTFDTSILNFPTLFILMFLMWVGASPSSVGGGIKTSTFAVAVLNIFSLAKGKSRIEAFGREITENTVRRSFAIILLSFVAIGLSVLLLSFFEKDFSLLSIIFETVSAYSTTGYSMGITPELSGMGKLIIAITIFVGRMTMLTVLIAFMKKMRHANYRYPTEEILIN
jgi:trk system potassium uptake protein TrkH